MVDQDRDKVNIVNIVNVFGEKGKLGIQLETPGFGRKRRF
jgi:hypothetical protein